MFHLERYISWTNLYLKIGRFISNLAFADGIDLMGGLQDLINILYETTKAYGMEVSTD
ncbi:hypothetical protein DPMN_080472 [Dreissena polymorpha]|uniref:Uncharacterized protein n=1 Tax=Dreissena polymorpha TaxID=45954 RepID=A0A9D3YVP6_DREPO|nr:hypothetical protein DPMN_080472 [Dreissena polymorpha]